MSAFENSAATPWISLSKAYVLLNGVRMFSIAALCFVDILIWFIMVNSFITHTFFFFDLISYLNLFIITSFLLLTELPQWVIYKSFKCYLATHWPLVSYTSGLKTLATAQISIGVVVLGFINNQDATSRGALGETWWRLMCSIGAFVILVGIANICATTICLNIDDGGKILSARQIRDPDTNIPSTVPGLRAFTCSRGFRRDLEKGMISPPVVVMRAPERVHSQKGHQGQWI